MGTSVGYSAPPSWGPLKTDVTAAANGVTLTLPAAQELVQSFVAHNGGSQAIARGGGSAAAAGSARAARHGGGSVAGGRAARVAAGRLASFVSSVGTSGLTEALRTAGWADLIGRPVGEVLAGLLDRLGGQSATIDEVDARMALSRLQDKYFGDVTNADELEQRLNAQVSNLPLLLQEYFGFYLFEVFCRVFFERLVQRVGESRAESFLADIGAYITSALTNRVSDQDMTAIDWSSTRGQSLVTDIMESTLRVFGD